ncbi:MAG: SpoIIE family protein phosphatase [Leptospiraceae bacterium]|nr:SpoIIE family protein phosphatase [Leptospiraceae bacterium]MCK6381424.1 SpoIIE family protein phosphatase [Leptospiraceae bacterium]
MENSSLSPLLKRNTENNFYVSFDPELVDIFQLVLNEAIRLVGAKRGSFFFLSEKNELQSLNELQEDKISNDIALKSFQDRKNFLLKKGDFVPGENRKTTESYISCYLGLETGDFDLGVFLLEGIYHFENFSTSDFELIVVYCNYLSMILKDTQLDSSRKEIYLSIATSILLLIENTNNYFKNSRMEYLLKEIIRVSGLINSSLDLSKLLLSVMESVKSVFRTESCSILLVDKERNELYFHIVAGEKQEELSRLRVPIGQGIAGTIAVTKKPMIINDAQSDPRVFKSVDKAVDFVTRNILGAPLIVNDEVIGVMEAINTIDRNNYNSNDIDLFLSFSDAAALAIQKTRLLQNLETTNIELEKKVSELGSLFELGEAVLESRDELDLLIRSVQIISAELESNKTFIFIRQNGEKEFQVVSKSGNQEKILSQVLTEDSLIYKCISDNETSIASISEWTLAALSNEDEKYILKSFIIIPIFQTAKRPFGAIVISDRKANESFDENHKRLLQAISSQITKGYENFKLNQEMLTKKAMEKEIEITKNIQNNLLPSLKLSNSNFEIGVKTVAAKEVSGDFFDYFQYSDGQFSFLVADVSGKSLPASIFMAMSSSIIRTLSRNHELIPEEILKRANQLIYEHSQSGMFVTLFYIHYNPANFELEFASAGHNDQLLIKKDGSYSCLKGVGAPLGVVPFTNYKGGKFRVEPGDIVALYTDGAIEEKNEKDEEFGLDRFVQEIISRKNKHVQEIVEDIYKLVDEYSGDNEQFDDFTVLLLKFTDDYQFIKKFSANTGEIPKLREFVYDAIKVKSLNENLRDDILLACDEAATNIVLHSYNGLPSKGLFFDCKIKFSDEFVKVLFSNSGNPFDRSKVKPPSVEANMAGERKGGFGVYLIEKLMDKVTYYKENGLNYILIEKKIN